MQKRLIIAALLIGLTAAFYLFSQQAAQDVSINKVTSVSPREKKEAAFQESQATSSDTSLQAIEDDLNNTVIMDEDFSDLE